MASVEELARGKYSVQVRRVPSGYLRRTTPEYKRQPVTLDVQAKFDHAIEIPILRSCEVTLDLTSSSAMNPKVVSVFATLRLGAGGRRFPVDSSADGTLIKVGGLPARPVRIWVDARTAGSGFVDVDCLSDRAHAARVFTQPSRSSLRVDVSGLRTETSRPTFVEARSICGAMDDPCVTRMSAAYSEDHMVDLLAIPHGRYVLTAWHGTQPADKFCTVIDVEVGENLVAFSRLNDSPPEGGSVEVNIESRPELSGLRGMPPLIFARPVGNEWSKAARWDGQPVRAVLFDVRSGSAMIVWHPASRDSSGRNWAEFALNGANVSIGELE